ncbi:YciI family protein [Cellulomonas sp. P24]|jgi:uncharacterized protein YciI|uniref:YciI family protein n=1 Tax=Cellulomonas sp. P24 TaxID=2885206 RepID=UPI00216B387E|nr:YciI family protein [Cellulomonas sp. P24]MCR6491108.1 YciI family protein [Cellulomonas sp. P24]
MTDHVLRRSARIMARSTTDIDGSPDRRDALFAARAFVLLLTYVAPTSRIDELLTVHRDWLDEHFADGTFLVSGPQVPRTGGAILASSASRAQIEDLVSTDPLVREGAATYEVIEFLPTRGPHAR